MYRNTSKLRIAHIPTLCPLWRCNVHILVSHFWSVASWRTLCSSPKLFWSYCKAFIMLSAPACCCIVQIITAHMVIHNRHHNSLVSLSNRPHTLTLSPSPCCTNARSTKPDHTIRSTSCGCGGGWTVWPHPLWGCIKSNVEFTHPFKLPGFLFSLLSSLSLHVSLWSFYFSYSSLRLTYIPDEIKFDLI